MKRAALRIQHAGLAPLLLSAAACGSAPDHALLFGEPVDASRAAAGNGAGASASVPASRDAQAGTGGAAGSSTVPGPPVACVLPHVLDDMEELGAQRCTSGGCLRTWYTVNDGSPGGTQVPQPGTPSAPEAIVDGSASGVAMHMTGSGFSAWGATLGLRVSTERLEPFDASRYAGVTFAAKGKIDGPIRLALLINELVPVEAGGSCRSELADCFKYHGVELAITSTWQRYRVSFGELQREDCWHGGFNPSQLVGIEFSVPDPHSLNSFELWVDDVALVGSDHHEPRSCDVVPQ